MIQGRMGEGGLPARRARRAWRAIRADSNEADEGDEIVLFELLKEQAQLMGRESDGIDAMHRNHPLQVEVTAEAETRGNTWGSQGNKHYENTCMLYAGSTREARWRSQMRRVTRARDHAWA